MQGMMTESTSQSGRPKVPCFRHAGVVALFTLLIGASSASAQLSRVGSNPYLGASPVRGSAAAYDPVNNVYLVVGTTAGNNFTPLFGVFTDASGNPLGPAFEIKNGGEMSHFPRVTYSPDVSNLNGGTGGFLVTWHGGLFQLSVRTRIVAYPNRVAPTQGAISSSTWQESGPGSAYSTTSKKFFVTWQASNFSVWGSFVGLDGNPIGNPINVSNVSNGGARDPSVAWNSATNEFGVLFTGWGSNGATTTFAVVDASGTVTRRNVFNFAAATYITDLTYNPTTGRYIGVWNQGGTYSAEFAANGDVVAQRLMSSTTGTYDGLSVSYNAISGSCLAVGQGPSFNIWAAELNGNGVRTSGDIEATSLGQPSYYPRAARNSAAADWDISFYSDNGQTGRLHNQVMRTSTRPPSSNISVAPGNLSFNVAKSGATITQASTQFPAVTFSAGGSGSWTATTSSPWLQVTGGSGNGNGTFSVDIVNPNNIIGGQTSLNGSITITAPGAPNSPITLPVTLTVAPPAGLVYLDAGGAGDVFAYSATSGGWARLLTQGGGGFSQGQGFWSQDWTVMPARFDNDALTDFFLFNTTTGGWAKMINTGNGFGTDASGSWWPGWQRFVMDMDGDGDSDVFLHDPATGIWFKAISNPGGFTYLQGAWSPGWEVIPMTLNADSIGDMFLINRSTGRWFFVAGKQGDGFTYPVSQTWFAGWSLIPGDFNGDGLTDLLLHYPQVGLFFVATTNATGFTYEQGAWSLGWTPIVADLNADGKEDLFLHDPTTGTWFEMISDGLGHFSNAGGQTWSLGWQIHPTDFNADGRADFLLYDPSTGHWFQALNLVLGSFSYTSGTWDRNLSLVVRVPNL